MSSMTGESTAAPTNNTTSPAKTSPHFQQQHRDEDPVLFAREGGEACGAHTCPILGQSRGRSSYEKTARTPAFFRVAYSTQNTEEN